MKKKIIASFLFLFLLFVAGIAITLHVINKTTVNLTALLTLHKVEVNLVRQGAGHHRRQRAQAPLPLPDMHGLPP